MIPKCLILLGVLVAVVSAFRGFGNVRSSFVVRGRTLKMTEETSSEVATPEVSAETVSAPTSPSSSSSKKDGGNDFSQFSVGQDYTGNLVGAKNFGVFVNINKGTNVLLPRSQMTRGAYERLKRMAETKSKDQVKLEIIGVSAENSTLSGKYVPASPMKEVSLLQKADASNTFDATVVGAHDFGIFAELDEYGVEGLVPASKLPDKLPAGTIQASYPAGSAVKVQVDEFKDGGKKLVLSMKLENRAEVGAFNDLSPQKWLTGVIQSVSSFGIFVRPAGYENVGLVHMSRIPRDLVFALKKIAPVVAGTNKTDVEQLFQEGDVVRIRTHAVSAGSRRIELSMLPYKVDDEDEDDYVVEGRDPEGEEDKFQDRDNEDADASAEASFDAEDTLLWWRGAAYVKSSASAAAEKADDDFDVLNESVDVVEGTWRRMFEVDLREDEADFSSKAMEAEIKELEEEIGELNGLDDDMVDCVGFGQSFQPTKIGSFVSMSAIPADWKEEMDFFKDLESVNTNKLSGLRAGKAAEQSEFESLLKEVEMELEQASARAPKRPEEPSIALDVVEPPAMESPVDAPAEASA